MKGKIEMTIEKALADKALTLKISGRIDSKTAPELEKTVQDALDSITCLVFDFDDVVYISSAGLRILLIAQKKMNGRGEMKVINVNNDIMEIFEVTGFTDILTIG